MASHALVLVFALSLVLNALSVGIAYAQNADTQGNAGQGGTTKPKDPLEQIKDIDALLKIDITATLAGLALAAGVFLHSYKPDNKYAANIQDAQKNFFRSFYMLIVCTGLILGLDFTEIFNETNSLLIVSDIVSKYGLFGASLVLLFKGSREVVRALTGESIQDADEKKVLDRVNSGDKALAESEIAKAVEFDDKKTRHILEKLAKEHKIIKEGIVTHKYKKK